MTIAEMPEKQELARDELGRLLPGSRLNPHGRPKVQSLTEVLKDKLETTEPKSSLAYKQLLANTLVQLAVIEQRMDAVAYIYDRVDGRPRQSVEVSSDDDPRAAAMRQLAEEMRLARLADEATRQHYVELPPADSTSSAST